MAEIGPFRAWRYNPEIGNIKDLASPLFDVVGKEQLDQLYKNPWNSIHLSVPKNPYEIRSTILQWKQQAILVQDPHLSIYVFYQYYRTNPTEPLKCRKGFISNVRLHEWSEQIILRHENIMPHSVNDRLQLLEQSKMNISPTHGLYTDPDLQLEKYMDECMESPVYQFTDYQGVINKFGIIQDLKIIKFFQETLKEKQIILADGHHRYTASLLYRNMAREVSYSNITKTEDYQYMYLTNTEQNEITIFPTHRLIDLIPGLEKDDIITKLKEYFSVESTDDPESIPEKISKKNHTFGILFKDKWLIATLKPGIIKMLDWNFPDEVKNLDLTIMHFFIIEKVLGIKGKDQKNSKNINFSFNFTKAVSDVKNGSVQMGIITREISINDVKRICYCGFTFPHKSTYFYPKVVSGLLFQSIDPADFSIEQQFYQTGLNI